jgi:hypothetical protein
MHGKNVMSMSIMIKTTITNWKMERIQCTRYWDFKGKRKRKKTQGLNYRKNVGRSILSN